MPKAKKDEGMSFYDIVSDYTIISQEIVDNVKITKLRTHSGHTAICRIPIKSEEEEQKTREKVCAACIHFLYPDLDLTKVKRMEIII